MTMGWSGQCCHELPVLSRVALAAFVLQRDAWRSRRFRLLEVEAR
jgi:hypothetical protein